MYIIRKQNFNIYTKNIHNETMKKLLFLHLNIFYSVGTILLCKYGTLHSYIWCACY